MKQSQEPRAKSQVFRPPFWIVLPPGSLYLALCFIPHRNAEPSQRKAKEAASTAARQSRLMNYHNFASRLSIQRLPAANSAKPVAKPEPRKLRRPTRRPFTTAATAAAALVLVLCTLTPRAEAAENDGARAVRPTVWRVNAPTLFVTLTGLGVALLRVPALWRRDLDC